MELITGETLRRVSDIRPPALAATMGQARPFQTQILANRANQFWAVGSGDPTTNLAPGSFDSALWITLHESRTPCQPQMTFLYLRILRTK